MNGYVILAYRFIFVFDLRSANVYAYFYTKYLQNPFQTEPITCAMELTSPLKT